VIKCALVRKACRKQVGLLYPYETLFRVETDASKWSWESAGRAADQKQTRSSTPGHTNKMINVLRNVIPIAILTIDGNEGVVGSLTDCWKEKLSIIFKSFVPCEPFSRRRCAIGQCSRERPAG